MLKLNSAFYFLCLIFVAGFNHRYDNPMPSANKANPTVLHITFFICNRVNCMEQL